MAKRVILRLYKGRKTVGFMMVGNLPSFGCSTVMVKRRKNDGWSFWSEGGWRLFPDSFDSVKFENYEK